MGSFVLCNVDGILYTTSPQLTISLWGERWKGGRGGVEEEGMMFCDLE